MRDVLRVRGAELRKERGKEEEGYGGGLQLENGYRPLYVDLERGREERPAGQTDGG